MYSNIVPFSIRAVVFSFLATIAKDIPVLWNKKKLFVNAIVLTVHFSRFQAFDTVLNRSNLPCIAFFC